MLYSGARAKPLGSRSSKRPAPIAMSFEQERINKNVNELSQKLLEGCKLLCVRTRHTRSLHKSKLCG